MFNLMSNCCTWVSKIQEQIRKVTILVVGLDKAGKTSSIKGMLRVPSCVDARPTHGCVRNELRVENYLVTLLDVGGSAESRGVWRELCGEAHGIIFVVDSSDRQRMWEVKDVLHDLLKQPRVAGKPLLVLANKQDKMNALPGSDLIEILSLEKLVNQSHSLCHIEPCSALMDLRRWSDRKTLRGLRWLLREVCLEYPELCARVAKDCKRLLEPREREKHGKTGKVRRKTKQTTLKKMLKTKKKKKKKKLVKVKDGEKEANEQEEEEEEGDGNEGGQENSGHIEKSSSALIPLKKDKLKRKTKVKDSPGNDEKPLKANGEKKRRKKKVVKVKRKNKINTEEMAEACSQPGDLSATFDLYRKAVLVLKGRQAQGQ
uniref:ADP-ribosylation factor-like 13A n=1 Tax=Monopterus albus TaxID=43700 RepID=A0A3Q3J7L2_MONAL